MNPKRLDDHVDTLWTWELARLAWFFAEANRAKRGEIALGRDEYR